MVSTKNKNLSKNEFIDPALKGREKAMELLEGKPLYDAMTPIIQRHKNKIEKIEGKLNKYPAAGKSFLTQLGFNALIEQNKILIKQNELIYLQNNDIINALEHLNKKMNRFLQK